MSAEIKAEMNCVSLATRANIAPVDSKREPVEDLKARLDDALRRLAALQQDLTVIRRELLARS